ncbi:MAG TPA: hypothetical protein VLB82_06545 [Thermodesulfobacteriota bacterium]|nr:hypothetical protein [Thermodesulfobacteriota bacterium]
MADNFELGKKEAMSAGLLLRRFENYWDAQSDRFDSFEDYYKAYRFYRDPESHPYKYNVSKPFVFTICTSFAAHILNSLYERNKIFDVMPTEGYHQFNPNIMDEQIAYQLEKVLNYYIFQPEFYFFEEMYDFVLGLGIYGNAVSQTVPMFTKDEEGQMNWQGSKTQYIDIFDFVPRPYMYLLDERQDFFVREIVDRDMFPKIAKERGYKNWEYVGDDSVYPEDIKEILFSELNLQTAFQNGVDRKGRVLLAHYHKDGHIITLGGNTVIVKDTREPVEVGNTGKRMKIKPFPFFPYDSLKLSAPPKEFYGIGLAEVAKQYQDNANLRGSQRQENIELGLMKTFIINYLYDIDPETVVIGAGNIIPVNDIHNSIKVLDIPDITRSSYEEDQVEKFEAQDATGLNETLRGTMSKVHTATTDILAEKAAQVRMQVVKRGFSNVIRSIGKKMIKQIHTWLPKEQYERILGQPDAGLYALSSYDLDHMFDITPSASGLEFIRAQDQANFVQAAQLMMQSDKVEHTELIKEYFRQFFPHVNPEKFIKKVDEMMPPQMGGEPGQGGSPPSINSPGIGQGNFSPMDILQGQAN